MSRRLRSADIQQLLDEASWQLTEAWACCWVKIIDAKPLPIGGFSKDGDARWGRGVKALAKGYKFYAIWGAGPMPLVWGLAAMNVSESAMANPANDAVGTRTSNNAAAPASTMDVAKAAQIISGLFREGNDISISFYCA
jgi:hypothetical protein